MKKFISVILTVSLIFTLSIPAFAANNDAAAKVKAPSKWAEEDVNKAADAGIFEKSDDFEYQSAISREEFADLAYKTLEVVSKAGEGIDKYENSFTDTQNKNIAALYNMGIVKGKSEKSFAPNDTLTRQEAATILWRMAEYSQCSSNTKSSGEGVYESVSSLLPAYEDEDTISSWAKDSVLQITGLGIMKGTGSNFEPLSSYTKEQALITMVRMYDRIKQNAGDEINNSEDKSFADNLNELMPSDKNYMFSPISIKMALALVANGAEGETQEQILEAMGVEDLDQFNKDMKSLIENYSKSDLLKLNISNSIWLNTDETSKSFLKDYVSTVENYYNAESDTVTNKNKLTKINGWVNEKTNGKISEILNSDNSDFIAMLVNAVYFKARWMDEFSTYNTKADTFTDRNGKASQIDFMNQTDWFNYSSKDGVQIVKLPYKTVSEKLDSNGEYVMDDTLRGMDVSMYVMMSDKDYNPEAVLTNAEFEREYVKLSLPKFKIEFETSLNDMLKDLGITKAFSDLAELDKMFDDASNTLISDSIHKTYINVDEEGTEAAAVTAIAAAGSSLPPEPIEVKFNKPFTFVVKDNVSGEILFMGEYAYNSR